MILFMDCALCIGLIYIELKTVWQVVLGLCGMYFNLGGVASEHVLG